MEAFTKADTYRRDHRVRACRRQHAPADRLCGRRGCSPLNDIAIAPDGTLYVTDSVAGAVWRVRPERDVFEPFVAAGTGIANIDPATGTITRLENAPRIPLGGIDGLLLEGHTLLAVQNGLGVPRLVAIELDQTATRATALTVLRDPDDVGRARWRALDAIGPDGLRKDKRLEDPRIVRTPLR